MKEKRYRHAQKIGRSKIRLYRRERRRWKIECTSRSRNACKKLAQEATEAELEEGVGIDVGRRKTNRQQSTVGNR